MLVKEITYTDYDGNVRTEKFYFNLSKVELIKWDAESPGGLKKHLEDMALRKDPKEIFDMFETIILRAYGVKDEDGRRFMKSEMITRDFKETEAYSVLFMELTKDEKSMADFVNAIVPKA